LSGIESIGYSNIDYSRGQKPINKPEHKSMFSSYDSFTKKMEEWQQPYFDGDGKLSGKEALVNEARGAGSLITAPLSSPIASLAIIGTTVGATAIAVTAGATLPVLAMVGAAIGGCFGLYHAGKAAYKFATANGDEKTLAEAHLNTGKAVVELPLAAFAGKKGYGKYNEAQKAQQAIQTGTNPPAQGVTSPETFHTSSPEANKKMYRIDPNTANHERRTSIIVKKILEAIGIDPKSDRGIKLRKLALRHDSGKGANREITRLINEPRKLSGPERELVKAHAELGAATLDDPTAQAIIKYHHTPRKELVNAGLPKETLDNIYIMKTADVADAMTGKNRPYMQGPVKSIREALPEIKRALEGEIDPELLPGFIEALKTLPN